MDKLNQDIQQLSAIHKRVSDSIGAGLRCPQIISIQKTAWENNQIVIQDIRLAFSDKNSDEPHQLCQNPLVAAHTLFRSHS